MSSRISLSAYKKKKEALATAPTPTHKRLGFGASAVTREARAKALQLETRSLDRLEGLLKKCGRNPTCARAKCEWLCSEGLKGHGKKGLSRLLCYVRVWSGALRVEGPRLEGDRDMDAAENRARAAFGACACALRGVDSALSRFTASSEEKKARESHQEFMKSASDVLKGMMQAMVGAENGPRSRGLHPVEHAQLSALLASWRSHGALPPSSLQDLEQRLEALKILPPAAPAGEDSAGAAKRRAAWLAIPPPPNDGSPREATQIGLSPADPADDDQKTSMEAFLEELLAHNTKSAGEWWGSSFEGRGPFREGPEGHWSLHLRRVQDNAQLRRKKGRGLLGINGDDGGSTRDGAWHASVAASGVAPTTLGSQAGEGRVTTDLRDPGDNGVNLEDEDDDGTPSTPSTVPSEAFPSPERASPTPVAVAPVVVASAEPAPTPVPESDVKGAKGSEPSSAPQAEKRSPSTARSAKGEGESGQPREDKSAKSKSDQQSQQKKQQRSHSREKRDLSKEEQEAKDRQRREEARRAGKEKGKMRGLEKERQRKDRELQRQRIIAETREKKEATAKAEREAKEKAQAAAAAMVNEAEAARRRKESEERARRLKAADARSVEEEKRRGSRGKSRERERKRARGEEDRDAETRGGRHGERAANVGRHNDRDGFSEKERERGSRGKEMDIVAGRDRIEVRPHLDPSGSSRERPRVKSHEEFDHACSADRGRDGRRAHGSHRSSGDPDADGGRLKHDSRDCDSDNGERKRRRTKLDHEAGDWRGERAEADNRDHRSSKKKSKKERKEKKEKRKDNRHSERSRGGSEEHRGRKRSRDFEVVDNDDPPPLDEGGSRGSRPRSELRDHADQPPRRAVDPHRQRFTETEMGRSRSERRDTSRPDSGLGMGLTLSRQDSGGSSKGGDIGSSDDRRTGRAHGSEQRSRRNGGDDAPGGHDDAGDTRERHATRAATRESGGFSSDGGGGLPGMDVYGTGVSPPSGLDLVGHGIRLGSVRGDHYSKSGSMSLDRHGLSASNGRETSPEGRRKGDGSRPRLAAMSVYGPGLEEEARGRSREERGERDRDHAMADRGGKETLGRRGDDIGHQSGSSSSRRRSPDRGHSSKPEGSGRWCPASPASVKGQDDSRERSSGQGRHGERRRSPVREDSGRAGLGKSMVGHGGVKSELSRDRSKLDGRDRSRLDDRDRHRLENRDRSMQEDRDLHMREGRGQNRLDDGDHPRLKEGGRKKPKDDDLQSVEDNDDGDGDGRRMNDNDRKKASNHDLQKSEDDDRPRLDSDRTKLGDRDRAKLDDRDRTKMEDDRSRLVTGDRQRLDERESQKRDDRDRSILENPDGPKLEDRDRQRLNDRDRSRLDDRDRSRPVDHDRSRFDDRDRLRSVDHDRPRLDDRDRLRSVDHDRPRLDERNRQRLEGLDRQRHDSRARPRIEDRDRLRVDDRDRLRADDRDRLRMDDRDRLKLDDRDRLRVDDRDRLRIDDHDRLRMDDRDRSRLNNRDRLRLDDRDRPRMDDVERQRLVDVDRQRPIDVDRHRPMDVDRPRLFDFDRQRIFDADRQRMIDRDRHRVVDRDRHRLVDRERQCLDERGRNRHECEEWPGRPQEWRGRSVDRRRMDPARHDRGIDRRNRGDSRDRHDSRDEDPNADADALGEEEPEEGELVIEPSAPPPTVTRPPSTFKKSRWGDASTMEALDGGVAKESPRSVSGRAKESLGKEGGQAPREGEAVDKSIGEGVEEGGVEPAAPQAEGYDGCSGGEGEKSVVGDSASGEVPTRSSRDESDGSRNGLKLDRESSKNDADEGPVNRRGDRRDSASSASRRKDVEPPSARAESEKQKNVSVSREAPEITETGGDKRELKSAEVTEDGEVGDIRTMGQEVGAASAESFSSVVAENDPGPKEPGNPRIEGRSDKGDIVVTSGAASREKGRMKQSEMGGAAEPSKRRSTGDPENLACFLRKNSSGTPAGATYPTATVATDSVATGDDDELRHQSASLSSTSQRVNASPRSKGSHDEPEAKAPAAGKESIVAVSDAAGPRAPSRAPMGLAATWGSGRSTDAMSGWGGSKEDGTSDSAGAKREGGGKEETSARPGGAATRLMNAALQSSRDGGRRDKKGGEGGRSRGWRSRGGGGAGGGYGSE